MLADPRAVAPIVVFVAAILTCLTPVDVDTRRVTSVRALLDAMKDDKRPSMAAVVGSFI